MVLGAVSKHLESLKPLCNTSYWWWLENPFGAQWGIIRERAAICQRRAHCQPAMLERGPCWILCNLSWDGSLVFGCFLFLLPFQYDTVTRLKMSAVSREERRKKRRSTVLVPLPLLKISLVKFSPSQRLAAQTLGLQGARGRRGKARKTKMKEKKIGLVGVKAETERLNGQPKQSRPTEPNMCLRALPIGHNSLLPKWNQSIPEPAVHLHSSLWIVCVYQLKLKMLILGQNRQHTTSHSDSMQ